MEALNILIVDNEKEIRDIIRLHLLNAGMNVLEADSGKKTIEMLKKHPIDLLVLDLMMENMNGWDVLHYIKDQQMDTPMIILSARQLESDKIETLGLGADDYVTKPFSPGELVARIQATLRRYKPQIKSDILNYHHFRYDRKSQQLHKSSGTVSLSPIEAVMLELFLENPGRVFTHKEIYSHIWKLDQYDYNSVKVYINYLRKKIEDDPGNPKYIQTIRGIGYRLLEEN